jgi:hypothetical protein
MLCTCHQPAGWPTSLLAKLGLSELRAKWPQDVLRLGEVVGHLSPVAAGERGSIKERRFGIGDAQGLHGSSLHLLALG